MICRIMDDFPIICNRNARFLKVKLTLSLKIVKRVPVNKIAASDWLIFKKQNNDLTIA